MTKMKKRLLIALGLSTVAGVLKIVFDIDVPVPDVLVDWIVALI